MPWVRLDENFSTNEKVLKAGKEARELYISALCHCNRNLTDGFVDGDIVRQLAAMFEVYESDAAVAKLLQLRLWESVDSGYKVHDYLKYNPSRAEVLAQREANARRQAKWQAEHRSSEGHFQGRSHTVDNAATNAVSSNRPPSPSPSPSPSPIPEPVPKNVPVDDKTVNRSQSDSVVPTNFRDWSELVRTAKNRPDALLRMYLTLYPGRDPPAFSYIGRAAKAVGGAGRLAELLWQHAARPPTGDVLAYMIAAGKRKLQEDPYMKPVPDRDLPKAQSVREQMVERARTATPAKRAEMRATIEKLKEERPGGADWDAELAVWAEPVAEALT